MKPWSSRMVILLGLLIPSALIVIPAVISIRSERELSSSYKWVERTMDVQAKIARLLGTLVDAETGQRGFLLTGRPFYLVPYERSIENLSGYMSELEAMVKTDPVHQSKMQDLRELVSTRMELLTRSVELGKQGRRDEAIALVQTDQGLKMMRQIRHVLGLMQAHEEKILSTHQSGLASKAHANSVLLIWLVVLNSIFVAVVFALIIYLSRLRNLVTMCAWSRTIEFEGEWISFEEYLNRRFDIKTSHGISPMEAQKAMDALKNADGL